MSFPERLFIVTVGTTVLSANQLGSFTTTDDSKDLRQCAADFLSGNSSPRLYERILRAHQDVWSAGVPIWPNRYATSAEMASSYFLLHKIAEGRDKALVRAGHDQIILLSSDTPHGQFCARVNAQLMHDHLFGPRCYCGKAFKDDLQCGNGHVEIKILSGMEGTEAGFQNIPAHLKGLWSTHAHRKNTQILVNITGGYKGIIPALTYMCISGEPSASLYYMHENMKSAASIHVRNGGMEYVEQDIPTFA